MYATQMTQFISKVTGGSVLTSCTSGLRVTKCKVMGFANLVLVDTPGLDDTNRSDLEVLNLISKWLKENYERKALLSSVLYFHRITDNRMAGTPLKNFRVFEKLCGDHAMAQVILVTTMWDEVEDDVGKDRLAELRSTYWKGMISHGSTTFRYENTKESATRLLEEMAEKGIERRHVRYNRK
ncbi:hypothetical protein J3A83DRAFT_4300977 [Scleroderma citrinum]